MRNENGEQVIREHHEYTEVDAAECRQQCVRRCDEMNQAEQDRCNGETVSSADPAVAKTLHDTAKEHFFAEARDKRNHGEIEYCTVLKNRPNEVLADGLDSSQRSERPMNTNPEADKQRQRRRQAEAEMAPIPVGL